MLPPPARAPDRGFGLARRVAPLAPEAPVPSPAPPVPETPPSRLTAAHPLSQSTAAPTPSLQRKQRSTTSRSHQSGCIPPIPSTSPESTQRLPRPAPQTPAPAPTRTAPEKEWPPGPLAAAAPAPDLSRREIP